jgi:hypothetical protein
MSHTGFLELGLLQTDGTPAIAPDTLVGITDLVTHRNFGTLRLSFPPRKRLEIPAFPETQALRLDVTPKRYRPRFVGPISIMAGETVVRNLTTFHLPDKWSAGFVVYEMLPVEFRALKLVLEAAPKVRLLKGGPFVEVVGPKYDAISEKKQILAKAALLNLYTKMRLTPDPTHVGRSWFDFVERFVEIGNERFIAVAKPEIIPALTTIRQNIDQFSEDYKQTPVGDHFKDYPKNYTVTKSQRVTIKTLDEKGNLQLTAAPAVGPDGNQVVLLDADIDENGKLMAHLADLFKHVFTGGTHPFDVYDYLKLTFGNVELGYTLV